MRRGVPVLLDADSVLEIDAQNPAALERLHLQILATGLGKVRPGWPTGLAGMPPRASGCILYYSTEQASGLFPTCEYTPL
jgi:hypothetical protein